MQTLSVTSVWKTLITLFSETNLFIYNKELKGKNLAYPLYLVRHCQSHHKNKYKENIIIDIFTALTQSHTCEEQVLCHNLQVFIH